MSAKEMAADTTDRESVIIRKFDVPARFLFEAYSKASISGAGSGR